MHVTFQQLRLLEAVARHGSFRRAAEALHLTPPAVSIQIKRLQEQVGAPLFEQIGKRIYLTAAGREVAEASRDILTRLAELETAVADLRGAVKGALRVSVVTTAKYFMPHLLGAFVQAHPGVEPRLTVANRSAILERLRTNLDDFVIMGRGPEDFAVNARPFLANTLVVVAAPGHPLLGCGAVSLERVAEERFLVREPGSGTRIAVEELFEAHGQTLQPYMELGSSEAIKQGVMAGLGVSVLPLSALHLERAAGRIAVLDVAHFPLHRQWYAVSLTGKRLSLVARTFLQFLLDEGPRVASHVSGEGLDTARPAQAGDRAPPSAPQA